MSPRRTKSWSGTEMVCRIYLTRENGYYCTVTGRMVTDDYCRNVCGGLEREKRREKRLEQQRFSKLPWWRQHKEIEEVKK